MTMPPEIHYRADAAFTTEDDAQLRHLLTTCFTKPQDQIFQQQRYFREPYAHRWVIPGPPPTLWAHVGLHLKEVRTREQGFPIGGICEVCVHPEVRGRGYVREMLKVVHAWEAAAGLPFSLLFGEPSVYQSSGYREVRNLVYHPQGGAWTEEAVVPLPVMVRTLGEQPWPEETVFLPGPKF